MSTLAAPINNGNRAYLLPQVNSKLESTRISPKKKHEAIIRFGSQGTFESKGSLTLMDHAKTKREGQFAVNRFTKGIVQNNSYVADRTYQKALNRDTDSRGIQVNMNNKTEIYGITNNTKTVIKNFDKKARNRSLKT